MGACDEPVVLADNARDSSMGIPMAEEIERKFLVITDAWRERAAPGVALRQGYLVSEPRLSVRVRVAGEAGVLTVKGAQQGLRRLEYEYPIPPADALEMLDRLRVGAVVDKTRYRVEYGGRAWEVDEFGGDNAGLVVAEVELESEDAEVALPEWVGTEVTHDPRYLNANLALHPYRDWAQAAGR